MTKLNAEAYEHVQSQMALLAQLVQELDLAGFLRAARHSESVGWIQVPTLYRAGAPALRKLIKLAESLQAFQQVAAKDWGLKVEPVMSVFSEEEEGKSMTRW